MSGCRSCDARIIWARTTKGRNIPVDAEDLGGWDGPLVNPTDPPGNLRPTGATAVSNHGSMPVVEVLAGDELFPVDGERRWRPHWATCPQADDWRRG